MGVCLEHEREPSSPAKDRDRRRRDKRLRGYLLRDSTELKPNSNKDKSYHLHLWSVDCGPTAKRFLSLILTTSLGGRQM